MGHPPTEAQLALLKTARQHLSERAVCSDITSAPVFKGFRDEESGKPPAYVSTFVRAEVHGLWCIVRAEPDANVVTMAFPGVRSDLPAGEQFAVDLSLEVRQAMQSAGFVGEQPYTVRIAADLEHARRELVRAMYLLLFARGRRLYASDLRPRLVGFDPGFVLNVLLADSVEGFAHGPQGRLVVTRKSGVEHRTACEEGTVEAQLLHERERLPFQPWPGL